MRVRRSRHTPEDAPKPVHKARITRTRPQVGVAEGYGSRIRRSRTGTQGIARDSRTLFEIDWSWGWSKKFQVYLMTSYLYYHLNRSLITDREFDLLCDDLLEGFDKAKHPHKYLVSKDDLLAGTGFAISEYPGVVRGAALFMMERHIER